jgi:hypothetical protein
MKDTHVIISHLFLITDIEMIKRKEKNKRIREALFFESCSSCFLFFLSLRFNLVPYVLEIFEEECKIFCIEARKI